MALPETIGFMVVLVIYYSLDKQAYSQSLNVLSKESMGTKESLIHPREKRAISLSSSDYEFQVVINISDLEHLRALLGTQSFPLPINDSAAITSIEATTVCSSDVTGYQCRCEQNFAWSYNTCISYGVCDAVNDNTCGCISALPADGQYCQPNTSQTEPTPSSTPPNDPVDIDIVLDIHIPVLSVPSNFIDLFRGALKGFRFPHNMTQSLQVLTVIFTTGCYPNSNGLQCQCEEQFSWSCDKCYRYGACGNVTSQTCGCINGLPANGQFCEPISNITQCPNTTSSTTPITTPLTNTTPVTNGTTQVTNGTTLVTTPVTNTTTPVTTSLTNTTPVTNGTTMTTPVRTTTPEIPPVTTTPLATSMTTPMTNTTTPKPTTPMMMTTPPPTTEARHLSLAMDIEFDSSYSNPNSMVYRNINNAIQQQSQAHISNLQTAKITGFRPGSTIVDYTVTATSIQNEQIKAVESGIFTKLAETYPMITDSPSNLTFDPPELFFGESVTVTCGPLPKDRGFSTNWIAEWRRNDVLILEDSEHSFSKTSDTATLTVSKFFSTDNGEYECKLRDISPTKKLVFRERSNGQFTVKETPVIRVKPVRKKVGCVVGGKEELQCFVNSPYRVAFEGQSASGGSVTDTFTISDCNTQTFTCNVTNYERFSKKITLELSLEDFLCENDPVYGNGNLNDIAVDACEENKVGEKIATCSTAGEWKEQNNCVLKPIQDLLDQSENLNSNSLPEFLKQLRSITLNFTSDVVDSPATINAVVEILNNVANTTSLSLLSITNNSMEDILLTAGILTRDDARESWVLLNDNDNINPLGTRRNLLEAQSASSGLLQSLETLTSRLSNDSFDINTTSIILSKTTFTDTFDAEFNSSVEIEIPESDGEKKSITVITFASMDNVLPARDKDTSTSNFINGRVVLVQSSGTINNIFFGFHIINDTLGNPQCVFWNFRLFDGLGGWDNTGCKFINNENQSVTCNCNHLTSFSILMSPYSPDDLDLKIITYFGVGISIASLVICLIIEAVIWKRIRKNNTSYLRHVTIVNIAVSLLIADIWFIIGAAISDADKKNPSACNAATFFIHFFYLALFFWMLASALLLLYRTVSVFDGGLSKKSMLAIGFSLGYGAPLIIAIITVAVTSPRQVYIQQNMVCWLNWGESKALLAFVIPALLIVVINLVILFVVIYKMLRRRAVGNAAQAAEKHALVVIARTLAVLTPIFGVTWSLGVGILIEPRNRGIHISFAFFNSLQGFFILLCGTLLDRKVRSEITIKSHTSRSGTRTTSAPTSSSSALSFFRNWRRGRDGYNVSASSSSASQSFTNT
uniref:adhesion G protein-coupled receptor F5-like n=1 Tax=Scatophagus argus TaxID=75038 RepID=UPI001ED7D3AF|nr:adhesion G protein-coupled receptor F5-like [Scatophagus argus]